MSGIRHREETDVKLPNSVWHETNSRDQLQRTHDVKMTSYNAVKTSHRHRYDVILHHMPTGAVPMINYRLYEANLNSVKPLKSSNDSVTDQQTDLVTFQLANEFHYSSPENLE